MGVYIFGVPGVHHPEVLEFLAEEDPFNLRRILSPFFLELVVKYRHGYLLWIVGEQFLKTVFQGDPGIVDLVHEEDIAPGELFFNLVDPLDLLGALRRLVVRAVEPQPHRQDGQVHIGLQDTGGYKAPGTDGDNQVRFESRSTDLVRKAGYGMMYVLIGKIEFFFGVHIYRQHTRGGAGDARQAGVLLDKCNRLQQNISMAVTIKDVARLAGVSTATVSRVLNHDRRIAPETFKSVSEVIAASGYRRNTIARSLKTSRSHAVGFLTPEIANDFFMYIAEGVEERLQAEGYSLIICNTAEKAEIEEKRIDLLSDQRVDGVIIIPAGNTGAHYAALSERDIPAVVVDRMVGGFDCDAVLVDNIGGSYSAALRFFEAGVRRIGFIGGRQDLTTAQERWEGFRRAHEDHHIKIDPELVCFGDFHVDSGYELAGRMMALSDPPRHLFIANYFMHVGATRYLLQSGTGTVRGIQTAGFDSMDLVPLLGFSAFTLSQPMREMGQTAAELLLRRIRRQYEGPPRIRRLPTGIITHQSISP